ncbi:MAG: ATP-binding protein [Lachnospiraceae bacterium]|nr:ATP-binding protein [Lachnospiraceae bacterium]
MKLRTFFSLRKRIFIQIVLAGIIPAIIITVSGIFLYVKRSSANDINSLISEAKLMSNHVSTSGYMNDQTAGNMRERMTAVGNSYSGRILLINTSYRILLDTYYVDEGRITVWENVVRSMKGEITSLYDEDNQCIIVTVPIRTLHDDKERIDGVLFISKNTSYIAQTKNFYLNAAFEFLIMIAFILVIVGIILSRVLTDPLKKMSVSIDAIKNGTTQDELKIDEYKEVAEISDKFNDFTTQMRMIDESRQEFVSNVSHELKTPLASMKVLADSINSMPDAPVDLYKEFMGDIGEEIDRETKTINDLLSLVRLDKANATLNISPVNINELMELLMKRLRPLAEEKKVELVLESFRPVTAEVDEVKFSLAIMNLVENGIKYNDEGGYVHVSVNSDHQFFFIRVEDNGMGIPDESLDSIFERFYRVDKSHSREIGGTGLGLAITKNAILMHHGEIKVSSTLGEGTTFDVRVPLSYIEKVS